MNRKRDSANDPFRPKNVVAWIAFFVIAGAAAFNFWHIRAYIQWRELLGMSPCAVIALFGYLFVRMMIDAVLHERMRYPRGHCQTCGYNLTGNASGRCSECGTPIP